MSILKTLMKNNEHCLQEEPWNTQIYQKVPDSSMSAEEPGSLAPQLFVQCLNELSY